MLKRAFDIAASGLGLIVVSPLLVITALAIKLDSAGPVFYRATRVGKNGQLFRLIKFRSMVAGADRQGPGITVAGDARITQLGAFLRRSKLDELPQLWNVLVGQMSFVGPRPEDPRYVELYTEEQRRVLAVRPGITSPASLAYRHEERILQGDNWEQHYIEEVMPAKLAIDLEYVHHTTLWQDISIIGKTLVAMFR
jgi:lipopolysaccharide/colanic/teichoic acid biosynthesis glycosyltransferase